MRGLSAVPDLNYLLETSIDFERWVPAGTAVANTEGIVEWNLPVDEDIIFVRARPFFDSQ